MSQNQANDGVLRDLSVSITLTKQQERDILRFYDTCENGQGYDVPKDRMKSLARLGLIRPTGFSRYEITDAGDAVIEKLRALLDTPACSACNDTGQMHEPGCEPGACTACLEKPAAQPQGEPVAMTIQQRITWMMCFNADLYEDWLGDNIPEDELPAWLTEEGVPGSLPGSQLSKVLSHELQYAKSRLAEQPASVAAVPDGYCIMPRQLTAENGAKALLLGEFKLLVTKECPECCELEEPVEGCSICDGEGEYGQKHTIPWDQIKFIYSKAVSGLAMKAESAKT